MVFKTPYSRSREPLWKERWQIEPWRKSDRGWPSKNLALLSKWHIFGRAESQADRFLIVFHSSAQFTEQRLSKAVSHIYCATPAMQKARLSRGRQSHQRCSCAIGGKETCLEVRQCSSCYKNLNVPNTSELAEEIDTKGSEENSSGK